MPRVGDLVIVHWVDAVGGADLDPGDDLPIGRAHTIGRVRKVTRARILLAAEWFDDGTERDVTVIPRVSITSIEVVRHA